MLHLIQAVTTSTEQSYIMMHALLAPLQACLCTETSRNSPAAPSNSYTRTLHSYEEQKRETQFHGLGQAARMRALYLADSKLRLIGMLLLVMRPLTGTISILPLLLPFSAFRVPLILVV